MMRKIAFYGINGPAQWYDEKLTVIQPQINDVVDLDLSVPQWERWIPRGLRKDYIPGDAQSVRLVSNDHNNSTYLKLRGFKEPKRKPKKSRGG